jgi:class 3 adenylate cyclase/tetratricopeptide (TPR) repeat protein
MGEGKSTDFNLNRYLPQELLTKFEVARSRHSMVGERRVITMLFCDVKGSTAAAEKVDPEIWTDIMNGVFEYMIRPIYKYEGLVPRLMGDAILAFFGAPITHEDDPQRAVLAGLEIQQGIQSYTDEIRRRYGLEFGLRVGINTGLVVVGEIGSDLRMEYTAIGDAINLAARMEQTAQVGTIQISEDTYKLVAPFFELEALGEVEVKGKAAPVKTYRVLGVKSTPGQVRGLEGLSSPLVGRDGQLDLLSRRLRRLEKGLGSFVAVIGEAGLGKSVLVAELKRSHAESGYQWLRGDALSYTRSFSYFPWRQVIRQSIDAREIDPPARVREKLRYKCDCCSVPGGDVPFLEAMLAVEAEQSLQALARVQGDALLQKMADATRGYLCGIAMEGPLAIILDDLHWADEASLTLLTNLADLAHTHPIFFVCMLRPDKSVPSWESIRTIGQKLEQRFDSIPLEPLQAGQTDLMLANLLGMRDLPGNIRDAIVEKADGNPFFIEEIIRSLIETGQLVRADGHWQVMSPEAKISLPNTLRGVLNARIDRLPEITRHVLQNAAVVGRSFDLRVLQRLTRLNGGLAAHIQYLNEASLIEPLQEQFAFRHVLIQEAAYDSILLKNRAVLHKQIGETLEQLHAERLEEFAPLLAHHFFNAQDERSLKYDLLAGEKAARLYANAEAASHFSRALEVARRTQADLKQIAHLHTQLGSVLELSGKYQPALANYDDLLALGKERHDRALELSALMAKATVYSTFTEMHDPALAEQMLIQALEISQEIGDRAAQVKLGWNLMLTYLFSKRLDRALQYGEAALALARQSDNMEMLAFVLNDLCRLYTCRGEFEQAHIVIREARELWQSLNNEVMLADSLGSESEAYFNAGEYDEALECNQQALLLCEKINNLWGQSYNLMLMSFSLFENGQVGRGVRLAEGSNQLADQAGLLASSISMRSELAWMYAYCGAPEKGLPLVQRALQVAEAKQPTWRSFPRAAEVRMHLLRNDTVSARQAAGKELLRPTSIPYARYTIFVCLANIELAVAEKEFEVAVSLANELLEEVMPLTRVDVPAVLRLKGNALFELGRGDEALQVLRQACALAQETDSNLHLWMVLADLARVQMSRGEQAVAQKNLEAARQVVERIAESLDVIGLHDSFLKRRLVRALMGALPAS